MRRFAELRQEITSDPLRVGYSTMTDAEVVALRDLQATQPTPGDLRGAHKRDVEFWKAGRSQA